MPFFDRDDVRIHFEVHGEGFPVLLIAPGGMNSAAALWSRAPWNPIEHLANGFRVIAMDQRNAGLSTAPIRATDGWPEYTGDELALLDHLGVDRFLVLGMCIGRPHALALAKAAPERFAGAVLLQPAGEGDNAEAFRAAYDGWADVARPRRPEVPDEAWEALHANLFGGGFAFSVSREDVARIEAPLLVFLGDDLYHPAALSREIVELAPNAELVETWKGDAVPQAKARVRAFLEAHAGPR